MSNLIQIKRSATATTPGSLANGELAFTSNGNVLYIGSPNGSIVPIGGARTPGVLTANQALVANTTGYLDEIRTANAVITKLYANGAFGSGGQVLTSNTTGGVFWSSVGASVTGSNTEIQFNDSGVLGSSSNFTFNKVTGSLSTNNAYITSTVNATTISVGTDFIANSTRVVIGGSTGLVANGGIGTAGQSLLSNGSSVYWDSRVSSVATGSGLSGGPITSTGTIAVVANSGIVANASGVFVNPGTGVTVNATGVHIGQAVATTSNVTFNTLTITGNTALGDSIADILSINSSVNTNIMPSANTSYLLGNNTMRWSEVHTGNVHSNTGYFDGDVQISGNLSVLGTTFTVSANNLIVQDPLIQLASNNTVSDLLDIGFYGNYNPDGGSHEHTGLYRDHIDDIYKLFEGLQEAPTVTVNSAAAGYKIATLQAYLTSGALLSNSSTLSITANSTLSVSLVANTLTLSTGLAGTSGGTGKNTMTNNAILVGNSTNGYNELALGTSGYVLQSNGTALIYDVLDGGTF